MEITEVRNSALPPHLRSSSLKTTLSTLSTDCRSVDPLVRAAAITLPSTDGSTYRPAIRFRGEGRKLLSANPAPLRIELRFSATHANDPGVEHSLFTCLGPHRPRLCHHRPA